MKILHVIPTLSPASGGPPEALRNLTMAYAAAGVEVEIVCQDDPHADFLSRWTVPVHATGARPDTYGKSPALLAWLQTNVTRFDGVVINSIWTYPSVAASKAAKDKVPYVIFTHGMLDPYFKRKYPLKHLKKYLYWPIQYPILRDAERVLFTSPLERDLAPQSFWPNKWNALVVPYGTGEPAFEPEKQSAAFYELMPALRGRRYILFLSRIHEKKGCDLLVEAFARVAKEYPDVDLVIAGPDQEGLVAKLQQMTRDLGIEQRVHWPGMLIGDAKYGAMRNAEAFILPSHQENFGVVVAESLACGRPVLISDQVNIWPEIKEETVGLIAPDTLDGTEKLLREWLAMPVEKQQEMAAKALPVFRRRYSMSSCAAAIKSLFEELKKK